MFLKGSSPSRGVTNAGEMSLWQALDKQLDLRRTGKGKDHDTRCRKS